MFFLCVRQKGIRKANQNPIQWKNVQSMFVPSEFMKPKKPKTKKPLLEKNLCLEMGLECSALVLEKEKRQKTRKPRKKNEFLYISCQ